MSPPKFQEADHVTNKGSLNNGARLSPLKITRDSHLIHKSDVTSSHKHHHHHSPSAKRHQPVIIYTHSPKVIHAQARDFMALVQKLTGFTRSDDESVSGATIQEVESKKKKKRKDEKPSSIGEDGGGACAGGSEEKLESVDGGVLKEIKKDPSEDQCLTDAGSANDFFYPSSNKGNSVFQSSTQFGYMGDYMKEFNEYK